jgi:hypothetical protein
MNKIEKYNYDEFKKDLPRYVVYLVYVDTNKPKEYEYYKKILSFNGSHKELVKYLEKEYKNLNKSSFFIVFKFGFHTGTKPLQGGPLSITISSLVKESFFNKMKNEFNTKLVSGYTKDNKYKNIHGKVWFQRKWLNVNGWSNDYLDCIVENLLNGKVKLLPLVVNKFNVDFEDKCKKRKQKNTDEIYKLINQLEKTKINKPINTKELKDKIKLIESFFKPTNINDILYNYDKYYYYIANTEKTILLSSSNDLKRAQKEALIKLKPNIDNLINKNIILVSINNVESEYKKDEKFNLIGGPIQIQLKYQIIKSKSKIIDGDGSVENVYLTDKYIEENKNNLLSELKKYVTDFKNNKLNSQQGIFNISKMDKKDDINKVENYLIKLQKKFNDDDNYYQAYKIKNNKIILIGNASTKTELNKVINENLPELIKEDIKYIIKITYNISIKDFLKGPVSITATIQEINKGKLSKKNMKVNTIYYTLDELQHRKLLKNDFKLLIKGLLNNTIDSNPLKIYTISDIINKKDETHSINDVINLMEEIKRTKINNNVDKDEINKLIKQLEEKKEEPKKYKKSKDDYSDYALSDFIEKNSHLFSNRF